METKLKDQKLHKDVPFAKRICEQLKRGDVDRDFSQLIRDLDGYFKAFARKKVYEDVDYEGLVNDFWIELQIGDAICQYRGTNQASLKTYLTKILKWRIMTASDGQEAYRGRYVLTDNLESLATISGRRKGPDEKNMDGCQEVPVSRPAGEGIVVEDHPEAHLDGDLRDEIISTALLRLSQIRPEDADLVCMRMKGLSYEEIARRSGAIAPGKLKKKIQGLRKQFTRPKTGSMARFRIMLDRVLEERGIKDFRELLDD